VRAATGRDRAATEIRGKKDGYGPRRRQECASAPGARTLPPAGLRYGLTD